TRLDPGVHMIAHDGLDDPATPRIVRWLPRFRDRRPGDAEPRWWRPWIEVLAESARLPVTDDRAIIRDNRVHGFPTESLLYAVGLIAAEGVEVHDALLPAPAVWSSPEAWHVGEPGSGGA